MEENLTVIEEDLISGDIKKGHLIKFIKQIIRKKRMGIFVYIAIVVFLLIYGIFASLFENGISSDFLIGFAGIALMVYGIPSLFLNGLGQAGLRFAIGAKKIERADYIEAFVTPVNEIITEVRQNGLTLPDDIKVYLLDSDEAMAYAFGMNSIAVSKGMQNLPANEFKAMILTELYRIHEMDPDYLLFMLGSNIITLIAGVVVVLFGLFNMRYGDSRKGLLGNSDTTTGAILFYGSIAILSVLIGICYLFICGTLRTNQFEADHYASESGYGEALCMYLDNRKPTNLKRSIKLLEAGHPSADQRVAALQREGVKYSAQ